MTSIHWNGLYITGSVQHDPGVHTFSNGDPGYPPSTAIEICDIEFDDPTGEFATLLFEHDKPMGWIALPQEAKDWVATTFDDELCEALEKAYWEDRNVE